MLDFVTVLKLVEERRARKDEQGIALFGVVLISTFVFTMVMILAGSTSLGSKITSDSRASMEAFTSAEAGRDVSLAELSNGYCTPVLYSSTDPYFTYTVYRYKATGTETPNSITQTGVVKGCPKYDSTHVLIQSVGTTPSGAKKTILSTYKWTGGNSTVLNSAIATGSGLNISGFSVLLPPGATVPGDIVIGTGDFKCSGSGTVVQGSVYVLLGQLNLQGCGVISGNVSSKGNLSFASSTDQVVGKDACTMASMQNYGPTKVGGTAKQFQSTCIGLDSPGWIDYNPNRTGAIVITDTNICSNRNNSLVNLIQGYTTPRILDLTACSGIDIQNPPGGVKLKTDVSLIANDIQFQNTTVTSADGAPHLFNLITPDLVRTTPPRAHCASTQGGLKISSVDMRLPMSGLIYSPCNARNLTGTWTGQIHTGTVDTNIANGQLYYVPVSAPLDPEVTPGKASSTLLSQVEY